MALGFPGVLLEAYRRRVCIHRISVSADSHYSHIAFSCLSPMVLVRHICITRTISDVVVPMRGVHVDKDG